MRSSELDKSSSNWKWRDRRKPIGKHFTYMHEIMMSLEIQPEFGFHSEKYSQPGRGIRGARALVGDDLADPTLRTPISFAGRY